MDAHEPMSGHDRRAEVDALLEADETVLGTVWRSLQQGKTVAEIADEEGTTQGPVYSNRGLINALLDGTVTNSPFVARQHAARIRSWLRQKPLGSELRSDLEKQEQALSAVSDDPAALQRVDEAALAASISAESENLPGVYVYTLPHYWRYKVDADNDRTYLKVGSSQSDVYSRVRGQRTTALPEDPWLLRVYVTNDAAAVEQKFHRMLDVADQHRAESRRGGREWFLTSLRILDWYAADQGLEIRRPNEATLADD